MKKLALLAALLVAGCSSHSALPAPSSHNLPRRTPQIFQKKPQSGWQIMQFAKVGGRRVNPVGMAVDGNNKVWAAVDVTGNPQEPGELVKFLMNGEQRPYPLAVSPQAIAYGPDGNMWVTAYSPATVSKVDTNGVETDYPIPDSPPGGHIIVGPDKAMWFTECSRDETAGGIARIDVQGNYSLLPLGCRTVIATDGQNIWSGDVGQNLYETDLQGKPIATYPVGGMSFSDLVQGSDGAMYAAAMGPYQNELLRADGKNQVQLLQGGQGQIGALANAPDGTLWASAMRSSLGYLISFDPKTQQFGQEVAGPPKSGHAIVFGPDGNVWDASYVQSTVGVYLIQAMQVKPNVVSIAQGKQTSVIASEANYGGVWTAIPTNTQLVSVGPENADGSFTLTGLAPGFTTVLIYDSMFNSVKVKVTVTAQE